MIIVDDRLSIDALAGRYSELGAVSTTWGFHYRLVRALADDTRWGALSGAVSGLARSLVDAPPPERLVVLDPRLVTVDAAQLAARHGLNVLAAELFASATRHDAEIHLSSTNVGRQWPAVMDAEGITYHIT